MSCNHRDRFGTLTLSPPLLIVIVTNSFTVCYCKPYLCLSQSQKEDEDEGKKEVIFLHSTSLQKNSHLAAMKIKLMFKVMKMRQ